MKKRYIVVIVMLAVALAAAGVFCAVALHKNSKLKEENLKIKESLESLEAQKDLMEAELAAAGSETKTETETLEETEIETESTAPLKNGKKIAIDPGHQSFEVNMSEKEPLGPGSSEMKAKASTGTTGKYTGVPEYELNLNISKKLRTELSKRGYEVVLTREDNTTAISNKERALLAYDEGADIYVRIHANGSEDSSVHGAMTMVPSKNNPFVADLYEESYKLGQSVIDAYCEATGMENDGVHFYDNMTGINWSKLPVIILEMGYMSNEGDDRNMQDAAYQEKMTEGIADGIDAYFGFEEKAGDEEEGSAFVSEEEARALIAEAKASGGQWAVYTAKADGSHQAAAGSEKMKAASLIKLYIMGAVYENYEALSKKYGAERVDSLLEPMITVSDNDAANTLTKMLGGGDAVSGRDTVNEFCAAHGYNDTSMGRMLLAENPSGENYTSVTDCGRFLEDICTKELYGSEKMEKLLKGQQRTGKIPAGVPSEVETANKTGELSDVENDAAIIYAENGAYILCVMSQNLSSTATARDAIVNISRQIYEDYASIV